MRSSGTPRTVVTPVTQVKASKDIENDSTLEKKASLVFASQDAGVLLFTPIALESPLK